MSPTAGRPLVSRWLPAFVLLLLTGGATGAGQVVVPPAAACHVTDGMFTVCPDGSLEWADAAAHFFSASNSYLYAAQADLSPALGSPASPNDTFMLMYDECSRTVPLGPNEYTLISFPTVEIEDGVEKLERYVIHAFSDGRIAFFENGHLQTTESGASRVPEIEGQRGHVGFGPSPNCAAPHVITEFEIKLSASGAVVNGAYSPDPLFWSSDVPPTEKPKDPDLPPCPDAGSTTPVTLHQVVAPVRTGVKPYQIIYGELPLQFTSGGAGGSACKVTSSTGQLPVMLDLFRGLPPPPFQIATSTATATLDFFTPGTAPGGIPACNFGGSANNCFINAPASDSNNVVRWTSPGFQETVGGVNVTNTGPLTFYANLGPLGSGGSFPDLLQRVEQFFHETLINNLSGIDRLGVVQDPPADLLVTDPAGRTTGRSPSGLVVTDIPRSLYFASPEVTAIVLVRPDNGTFNVDLVGAPGDPFSLSMSVADFFRNVTAPFVQEQIENGVIAPGGTSFQFRIDERLGSIRPGFDATAMPRNDDGSTGPVPLGFDINFFGSTFSSLFVNNNGNVTFDFPLGTFTPFDLTSTGQVIVAPFFADVDTRAAGEPVRYGSGTVDGHPAFGVSYLDVDCFASSAARTGRNFFQLVLISRADRAAGDFDIEFNYDRIQWETGQASGGNADCLGGAAARAGFSNGSGLPGTFFEFPGSGVPGAFLDGNPVTGLANNGTAGARRGGYVFAVSAGTPDVDNFDGDLDGVADGLDNCPQTSNPEQIDSDFNGIGDVCQDPAALHSTAGFLQALFDGGTSVEPSTVVIGGAPALTSELIRIVQFRLDAGLTDDPGRLARNLVDSIVAEGGLAADQAAGVVDAVLRVVTPGPDGRMSGAGHIDAGSVRHHFLFRVTQSRNQDDGRLEYWTDARRGDGDPHDRDDDRHGDRDDDYGGDHRGAANRFVATSIADVTFFDDPALDSGNRGHRSGARAETVRFSGAGAWNGRSGYTFDVVAIDAGESGVHRDMFSLRVRDEQGHVVADVNGDLGGGNVGTKN